MSAVFDAYARYYDLLYRDKDYCGEAQYVAESIRARLPRASRILELGCGTGAHAEHLARLGFHVHGVDSSARMVEGALGRRARASSEVRARLSFAAGDVRNVRTGDSYDAVISLFHVMSYQLTNSDIDASFRTAAAHLDSGGVFFFDFWYGPAVLTQRPETRVRRMEDATTRVLRIAESSLSENEDRVDVKFTVFVDDLATGRRDEIVETHRMRYLFLPEVQGLLASNQFNGIDAREWLSEAQPSTSSWSACVSARKIWP
jgi:SAM-dependent methyltransferase